MRRPVQQDAEEQVAPEDGEARAARDSALPHEEPHLGKWLVETLKGLGDIELPSRGGDRPDPFADWTEEDFGI